MKRLYRATPSVAVVLLHVQLLHAQTGASKARLGSMTASCTVARQESSAETALASLGQKFLSQTQSVASLISLRTDTQYPDLELVSSSIVYLISHC